MRGPPTRCTSPPRLAARTFSSSVAGSESVTTGTGAPSVRDVVAEHENVKAGPGRICIAALLSGDGEHGETSSG